MNAVIDKIPALVDEELAAANAKHPPFNSAHEGYAVMLEEVDEVRDELAELDLHIGRVWRSVRHDDDLHALQFARRVKIRAISLAAEAIQVAAMAEKMCNCLTKIRKSDRHE